MVVSGLPHPNGDYRIKYLLYNHIHIIRLQALINDTAFTEFSKCTYQPIDWHGDA